MIDNFLRQTATLTLIQILEIDRIRRKERDSEAMEVLLMREDRSDLGVPQRLGDVQRGLPARIFPQFTVAKPGLFERGEQELDGARRAGHGRQVEWGAATRAPAERVRLPVDE